MGISISSKKVIKVLKNNGFIHKKGKSGSHQKFKKGNKTVMVPHPEKHIPIGTLYSIIDQSGLPLEDFIK